MNKLAVFKHALWIMASALLLLGSVQHVSANETTSAVRGTVVDENGSGISNASVMILNEATGFSRTVQTGTGGEFTIRNLPVDEDYTVTVEASGYAGKSAEGLALGLGHTATLSFSLDSTEDMEEVRVVATRTVADQVAVGPNAAYGLRELQSMPAINRNITDVLRVDPRIYVDESRGDINAIQCGGKNSRFNSLTVDGVRTNDSFGLNSNGYPTERMPFSYDAIEQIAVELAPFDAAYGGFTACNINAVTKSGTNRFSGGVFFDYTGDSLRNDSLEGDSIETGDYTEERYGFQLGGPIVQDTLFFFAAYEKLEGANLFDRGALGSGAVNEVNLTQAEVDEIVSIAQTQYQYDPGPVPSSLDNEDEKLLLKLDWYINDQHRGVLTYTYNDGQNFTESDSELGEFEFQNHLYERGAELNSYVGTVYSDWTPDFSTSVRIGYLKLENRQNSFGGNDFGEIIVETDDVDVYLGGDDSRQSNELNYDTVSLSAIGEYTLPNGHLLTFGYEREALDIFNLFVQHTETQIEFDGIDNFRDGFASSIEYNNAPSNNPRDAAADWGYELNTLFVQDEFDLGRLSIVGGVRYDWYTSDDVPEENADFVADYGFSNSTNLDGEGLFQPRLGLTYYLSDWVTLRGGVGLYSGGNPNVWLSNNYSANNVLQFGTDGDAFGYTDGTRSLFDPDVVYEAVESDAPAGAGPGWGIPQELYDAVATGTGTNFEINYLDPNFEIPSEWKISFGTIMELSEQYTFSADLLITDASDSAIVLRGDLEQVGTTPEGYPQYASVREPSFVLTNSTEGDESLLVSLAIQGDYYNGIDWRFGYAYSDAEDVQPMTSSVAFSNYTNRAFFDPQEQVLSTSNYNIRHRFTAALNYERAFFGDNLTTISLYGHLNEGQPYSIVFDGTADPYSFTPFIGQPTVLRPGTERNANYGSWWGKIDFRIEQEFPGFIGDSRGSAFLVIDNLTNLLNDDWGVLDEVNFPNNVEEGQPAEARIGDASRYEIRFGMRFDF